MLYLIVSLILIGLFSTLILHVRTERIMALLDDIIARVTELKTVDDSVVALLTDLKARLDEAIASGDLAKLQVIADAIGVETARLSAAVTANTPTP